MFGKMLDYLQSHYTTVKIRQNGEKRSFVFANVPNVETAVAILNEILS
jgi:hypothetical protein